MFNFFFNLQFQYILISNFKKSSVFIFRRKQYLNFYIFFLINQLCVSKTIGLTENEKNVGSH